MENIMKNHKLVDGKLLQINKKWSHLKSSQRDWIRNITEKAHKNYVFEHGKLPIKKKKYVIFDEVEELIKQREIWIPFPELKMHVNKIIDRLNRKSPLFRRTSIEQVTDDLTD